MDQDREHLRLLSIFHYVVGGIAALFGFFPIIHVFMGIAMLSGRMAGAGHQPPPEFFGWLFVVFGIAAILCFWTFAAAIVLCGRFLAQHRFHTYCFVITALESTFMPFGTVLGALTLVVLCRPSVKTLFEGDNAVID